MTNDASVFSKPQHVAELGIGSVLILVGVWCFIHPDINASYGAGLMLLGSGLVALALQLFGEQAPLSIEQLQQQGIGQIVAKINISSASFQCQHCRKNFTNPPLVQGASYFCSEACKQAEHTRLEKPKYYLQPPLPPNQLHDLLEQAIQFSERAMQTASNQEADRPLLLAMHRGKGASSKIRQVILSLKLYNQSQSIKQLEAHPPPEPLPQGGFQGDPSFVDIARNVQRTLSSIDPAQNPFAIFQLTEPIELLDIKKLHPFDQQSQEAYAQLKRQLEDGEKQLQKILSSTGSSKSPPPKSASL